MNLFKLGWSPCVLKYIVEHVEYYCLFGWNYSGAFCECLLSIILILIIFFYASGSCEKITIVVFQKSSWQGKIFQPILIWR